MHRPKTSLTTWGPGANSSERMFEPLVNASGRTRLELSKQYWIGDCNSWTARVEEEGWTGDRW
jgi:hypothetical protein